MRFVEKFMNQIWNIIKFEKEITSNWIKLLVKAQLVEIQKNDPKPINY